MSTEDRFIDIARRVDPAQVAEALRSAYEMKDGQVRWHLEALETLRAKKPGDSCGMMIRVRRVTSEHGSFVDVDAIKKGEEIAYSLSMTPWAEWAAMPVSVVGTDMSEAQVVAHCIWEMTYLGTEEDTAEIKETLIDAVEEIKAKIEDGEG